MIYRGVDLDQDVRPMLPALQGWCSFVGRYSKNLTQAEYEAITAAGQKTLLIFEVGTQNTLGGESQGRTDGQHFLRQMSWYKPGPKTGVFPACDTDPQPDQIPTVQAYWYGFSAEVFPAGYHYMGGYAPGSVLKALLTQGLAYPWSAGAKGWSGTRDFDLSSQWVISQGPPLSGGESWPRTDEIIADKDGNYVHVYQWPDIGAGPQGYDPNIAVNLDWAM